MKVKSIFIAILIALSFVAFSQTKESYIRQIESYQTELNKEFADSATSPLTVDDLKVFKGLDFFPINPKYCVTARFIKVVNQKSFEMKTTTDRKPLYIKYAEIHFEIDSVEYKLDVYRNIELSKKEGYEDYLFIPFTDATNGISSYGGGRYLEINDPKGDTVQIDFNKAFNPYCSYNKKYSCPVPPSENDLPIEILAGVMKYKH